MSTNNIAQPILRLFSRYSEYLDKKSQIQETTRIQVDEIATKLASFYEKIRNLIDYQESHLLRKSILERALRRRVFLKDFSGAQIAEPLIKEIIRAGHLPNNTIPECKILEIQEIIDKFLKLHEEARGGKNFSDWLTGMIVCEIEARLASPIKELALSQAMYETILKSLVINNGKVEQKEKELLLFLAIQKALLRADRDLMHYRTLNYLHPEWLQFKTDEVRSTAAKLRTLKGVIERHEEHKLYSYFFKLAHRYNIIFQLVGDITFQGKNIDEWESEATQSYKERYNREKGRLFRLAFLSVISFLLSKLLVAFAIELPIDLYVLHQFSWTITIANIIFPPFLMFVILTAIRLPSERNLGLVLEELRSALFEDNAKNYTINIPKQKSLVVQFFVGLVYVGSFMIFLYFLSKLLLYMNFSEANIVIFVLFTSLVTATGVKIFNRSKDMNLEKDKPKLSMFLLDLITIPLVTIGRWVMAGIKKVNIFVIIFNFFIELPFQVFVEFLENFNSYIRTKKEEIQ